MQHSSIVNVKKTPCKLTCFCSQYIGRQRIGFDIAISLAMSKMANYPDHVSMYFKLVTLYFIEIKFRGKSKLMLQY